MLRIIAAWWAGLFGLWLLLVFKLELAELVTGAVCSGIAVAAVMAVKREAHLGFRPRAAWLLPLLRLPWHAVRDSAIVFAALPRRPRGSIRKIPFEKGNATLATWRGSFAPNAFVIAVDEEAEVMLVHELVRR